MEEHKKSPNKKRFRVKDYFNFLEKQNQNQNNYLRITNVNILNYSQKNVNSC